MSVSVLCMGDYPPTYKISSYYIFIYIIYIHILLSFTVCLLICPSVNLSVCLSVRLSICMYISISSQMPGPIVVKFSGAAPRVTDLFVDSVVRARA